MLRWRIFPDNIPVSRTRIAAMPAIGTSSDLYQHRDPALTTYRRNAAAPTLAEAMAERPQDRQARRTDRTDRRPGDVNAAREPTPIAAGPKPAQGAPREPEPVTPARAVHELYAPPSRHRREHDDRHAVITGGTIDLRA